MKKRSTFNFTTEAEIGIDKLPIGSLVIVDNYASVGSIQFLLSNKTNLTASTTIAQAVTASNLIRNLLPSDYTTATSGGTVKVRVAGSALYLTTNGVNP